MALFTHLYECYMVAISTKAVYTMDQLINKAYTAMLLTGLYKTPCIEFKGMETEHQTYATLKEHMMQAFELRLQMETWGDQNTAFNSMYNTADDNLMETIKKSIQTCNSQTTHQQQPSTTTCLQSRARLQSFVASLNR